MNIEELRKIRPDATNELLERVNNETKKRQEFFFETLKASLSGDDGLKYETTDAEASDIIEAYEKSIESSTSKHNASILSMIKEAGFPERNIESKISKTGKWWEKCQIASEILSRKGSIAAIIGKNGTGKTQMAMKSIGMATRGVIESGKHATCLYAKAMDFYMEVKRAYRKDAEFDEYELIAKFSRPTFLVIDELGKTNGTEWEKDLFFHMLDTRYGSMKNTVIISNLAEKEFLELVGNSVADRIADGGGIIECNWESFRGRKP